MTLRRIETLSDLKHGDRVRCSIMSTETCDCRVSVAGSRMFLCQNIADGNIGSEMFGYDFSWEITPSNGYADLDVLRFNDVAGLRKIVKEGT